MGCPVQAPPSERNGSPELAVRPAQGGRPARIHASSSQPPIDGNGGPVVWTLRRADLQGFPGGTQGEGCRDETGNGNTSHAAKGRFGEAMTFTEVGKKMQVS